MVQLRLISFVAAGLLSGLTRVELDACKIDFKTLTSTEIKDYKQFYWNMAKLIMQTGYNWTKTIVNKQSAPFINSVSFVDKKH